MDKKWTDEDLSFLHANYDILSYDELSSFLGISQRRIKRQCRRLRLLKKKGKKALAQVHLVCASCDKSFTRSQYDYLRAGGKFCSNKCASKKRQILGPTKEELSCDYEMGLSSNDLAKKYSVSKGTIYNLFKKFDLPFHSPRQAQLILHESGKGREMVQKACETKIKRYGTLTLSYPKHNSFKAHFREDLQVRCRSRWEANLLRYFRYHNIPYQYEPKVFFLAGYESGPMGYMPDIQLLNTGDWIEIKGHLWRDDGLKLRRFKEQFPTEFSRLKGIPLSADCEAAEFFKDIGIPIYAYYQDLKTYKQLIPEWED